MQVTTVDLHVGRVETCQMSSCIILHLLGIIIFKNFPNTIVIVFFTIYSVFSGGSLKLRTVFRSYQFYHRTRTVDLLLKGYYEPENIQGKVRSLEIIFWLMKNDITTLFIFVILVRFFIREIKYMYGCKLDFQLNPPNMHHKA